MVSTTDGAGLVVVGFINNIFNLLFHPLEKLFGRLEIEQVVTILFKPIVCNVFV